MKNFREFITKIEGTEYEVNRHNFREYYTALENFWKTNKVKSNPLDWLSNRIDLTNEEKIKEDIINLITLDYVKANDFRFEVKPLIRNATNFLRNELLQEQNEHNFNKNKTMAILLIIEQIRNNITHDGKIELEENQYNRNEELILYSQNILEYIVQNIE